jgi:hypothetical protein
LTVAIEVLDVKPLDGSGLAGFSVDLPVAGTVEEGYNLTLSGWALTPEGPPPLVRLSAVGAGDSFHGTLAESRLLGIRPRLADHFANIPEADRSGFLFYCSLVGVPPDHELVLSARLSDGRDTHLARFRVRRDAVPCRSGEGIDPVLLETPGRSGSTWLTALLGQHPQVVTYRPFEREPRVASYWMEVFRAVAGPTAYSRAMHPDETDSADWWIVERDWLAHVDASSDVQLNRWLVNASVDETAAFCRTRIDGFYRSVALDQGKANVAFFAERAVKPRLTAMVREFFPGLAKIHLIRDPRDILVSRFALNARTGRQQFGRNLAATDEEYVREHFAREMKNFLLKWERADDRALLVRYEDLIRQPEDALQRIFVHLGIDNRSETVARVLDDARHQLPQRQEAHRTTADRRDSIERWREDLDADLLDVCEQALGDTLARLGYAPAAAA